MTFRPFLYTAMETNKRAMDVNLGPANQLLSRLLGDGASPTGLSGGNQCLSSYWAAEHASRTGGVRAAILLSCEPDSPMGQAHGGLYAQECDTLAATMYRVRNRVEIVTVG